MSNTQNQIENAFSFLDRTIVVQVFAYITSNIKRPNAIVINYMTGLETIVNEDKENPNQREYARKVIALCREIHSQIYAPPQPTPNFKEGGYVYCATSEPEYIINTKTNTQNVKTNY